MIVSSWIAAAWLPRGVRLVYLGGERWRAIRVPEEDYIECAANAVVDRVFTVRKHRPATETKE